MSERKKIASSGIMYSIASFACVIIIGIFGDNSVIGGITTYFLIGCLVGAGISLYRIKAVTSKVALVCLLLFLNIAYIIYTLIAVYPPVMKESNFLTYNEIVEIPPKPKKLIIATIILMAIGVLSSFSNFNGDFSNGLEKSGHKYSSYQSAISAFANGLTKADAKIMENCMFTPEMSENIGNDYFSEWKNSWKLTNDMFEIMYEKEPKYKFKIKKKQKLDTEALNDKQHYYNYYFSVDEEIENGYTIEAEMKISGQKEIVYFDVVKIENNGWKICPDALKSIFSINSIFDGGGFDY